MILKDSGVKRLAVYVLHDNDGIVDTYIDAFLKGLRSEVSCLRVVITGVCQRMVKPGLGQSLTR